MFHLSLRRCIAFPIHRDTTKTPRMLKEVGTWLYKQETVDAFRVWCKANYVRGNRNVRVVSSIHYARCLRAAQHLRPGQAILTCPYSSCFNFLVVAREMYNLNSSNVTHNFPLEVNWMNYNERCSFLHGASISEMVLAGWMCRIASLEESSFTPFIKWLLEDTRGRDGIANGVSKERGEESGLLDHYFSEMATDACEDPEVFLENVFRSFAALHLRAVPIEPDAIRLFIPGTNFFKASADDMFVPTLIPLIDAVPQVEDGLQNTVVQFFPYNIDDDDNSNNNDNNKEALKQQCREMFLSDDEIQAVEKSLPNGGGFFALRALCPIEQGDYLYLRGMPKLGDAEQESMTVKVMEANRLMNND